MSAQITSLILIAATIPFVVSILSALSPKTKAKDVGDYFLYDSKLDVDSFIKTTVGYSLQVASIVLFFYWTLQYGLIAPLIVCISWGVGYAIIAKMLCKGKLDNLLGVGAGNGLIETKTIHGIIGKVVSTDSVKIRGLIIFLTAMASVIGIGGTMMTEIDYSTSYIINAISSANNIIIDGFTFSITSLSILLFTAFYVLWGGYRSVVFTDRFQTPIAYGSFALFSMIVAIYGFSQQDLSNVAIIFLAILTIYGAIGYRRWRLINKFSNDKQLSSNRLTTFLTFSPILFSGAILLATNLGEFSDTSWSLLSANIYFETPSWLGFGYWGLVALIFVNAVWQLIDISSLQRLQSLEMGSDEQKRIEVAQALTNTGIEAGLGWLVICFSALLLKASGFSPEFLKEMILQNSNLLIFAAATFIFTCVVYMLSTISGFISALAYISYYDLVPVISRKPPDSGDSAGLNQARLTTIAALAFVVALYVGLKSAADSAQIAYILYAIYAFQIVILPSALLSITGWLKPITPFAVLGSIVMGMLVAGWAALTPTGWQFLANIGMTADSWAVIPPFFSALASIISYVIINRIERLFLPTKV